MSELEILYYVTANQKCLFKDWFYGLSDKRATYVIAARLGRLKNGNWGDTKYLGKGIWELRIFYASGLRVYFGKIHPNKILVLCAGDKSTQEKDIKKAILFYREYINMRIA